MKTRTSATAAAALIAVAGGMLVSWTLLTRGVAQALAKTSPELALRFHAADPEALVRINESEVDPAAKARRARLVMAQRPMDGRAYRQLAETEEAAGRTEAAAALFRVAVRRTPRDRLAQAWMADDALARGDADEALRRLALLADMDATLWPRLFPYMRALARNAEASALLVEKMAYEPAWRSQFLSAWAQESPASFDTLMLALEAREANLTPAERELWVQHLIEADRWSAAYLAWVGGLDANHRPKRAGAFNGGFEMAPAGRFDWSLARSGARKDLLVTAGAQGERALRVQFIQSSVPGVEQMLVLTSGVHVLDARARLDGLRSEGGLVWSVRCVRDDTLLGTGPALRGDREWHSYRFTFDVPQGCPAQRLALELPARTAMERRTEGIAWFDDISVTATGTANRQSTLPRSETDASAEGDRIVLPAVGVPARASAGVPAAMLVGAADGATIERRGGAMPAGAGALLLAGDRVGVSPPGLLTLRWRDGCERQVAAFTIAVASPCATRLPLPPAGPVQPKAREIVRASLAENPGARGGSGADLPVGP